MARSKSSGGGPGCFLFLLVLIVWGLIARFRQNLARSTNETWSWVILAAIGVALCAALVGLFLALRAHAGRVREREYAAAKAADVAARQAERERQQAEADWRVREARRRAEEERARQIAAEAARQSEIQRRLGSPQWANADGFPTPRRPLTRADRRVIFDRDGGRCCHCGETFDLQYNHIVPLVVGGSNELSNLQLLCGPCNQRKGGRLNSGYGRNG